MSATNMYFSKDHEWVRIEGELAYIGITDFAQKALGEIVYVELPDLESTINVGDIFGVVESVKAASDMFMPVDGIVKKVNEELNDEPEKLNADAMQAWIMAVELTKNIEELELMTEEEYKLMCEKEA